MTERGPGWRHDPLLGPRIVAAALVVGGGALVYHALQVGRTAGYTVVGPSSAPIFVSTVLIVLGLLLAIRTTISRDDDLAADVAEEERAAHWPTVGWLLLALVVYAIALNGAEVGPVEVPALGYVLATGAFLPLAARVLGSESPLRDVLVGFGLAIAVYIALFVWLERVVGDPFKAALAIVLSQMALVNVDFVLSGKRSLATAAASAVILCVSWSAVAWVYGRLNRLADDRGGI